MLKRELLSLPHHRSWALTHLKDAGVPFQWHYHPEYEITLTLGAEGMRYIGEDVAPFGHCDLALVGPDVPHTWDAKASDGTPEVYVVFLPRHWLQAQQDAGLVELAPLLDWLAGLGNGAVFGTATARRARRLFERMAQPGPLPALAALLELLQLLRADEHGRPLGGRLQQPPDRRLDRLLGHLQRHYQEPLRLEQVARHCNLSPATLKRLLQQHCDTSFSQYLNRLRLGHACHLLTTSPLPVALVREQAGFNNASHFNRSFLAHTGLSPLAFRRRFGWRRLGS
ncbi:helix-turn-helix domain-containing protein [Zobellella denitrificans]